MNPIESFLIDGKPEVLQSVVLAEMSLSSNRATMVRHSFAFGINVALIAELLEPYYVALVAELRRDDSHFSEPQDALATAGYPVFREVLRSPELTELVLGHYLLHDWLGRFTSDGSGAIKYWFDSITHCQVTADQITLLGDCYR